MSSYHGAYSASLSRQSDTNIFEEGRGVPSEILVIGISTTDAFANIDNGVKFCSACVPSVMGGAWLYAANPLRLEIPGCVNKRDYYS